MPQKLAWLIEPSFYLEASGESGRSLGVQELPYPPIHTEALALSCGKEGRADIIFLVF